MASGVGRVGCRAWGTGSLQVQVGRPEPSPQGWLSCCSLVGVCDGSVQWGVCDESV